ncbi:MAG: hypothetical protein JSW66_11660 [Phycisphaerales bacterium]|nr:MAG: hypothetical protein JSW66_11660 [Phycisphaerales bacterium]
MTFHSYSQQPHDFPPGFLIVAAPCFEVIAPQARQRLSAALFLDVLIHPEQGLYVVLFKKFLQLVDPHGKVEHLSVPTENLAL